MRTVRLPHLLLSAAVAAACGDGTAEPEQPANQVPVVEENLPWIQLRVGGEAGWLDASSHFTDPEGLGLTFAAESGRPAVASVAVEGSRITVTPEGEGRTAVAVTATDRAGASVQASYRVDVRGPAAGSFNIDLIFAGDPINETQAAAFERAADYWMAILADTELPDVAIPETTLLGCGEDTAEQRMASADDVVVVANVRQTNRIGLAFGGVCRIRNASGLPYVGRIIVSSEALGNLEAWADARSTSGLELLENLILHEIGHVLGIGTLWGDLVGGSSTDDPHFTGPLAIAAFDDAGGSDYAGAKVPVEERIEAHWREDVFDGDRQAEVMTPTITIGASLSAITIQSLADLEYTVDVSLAQAYRLPGTNVVAGDGTMARGRAAGRVGAALYRVGDDVLRGPVLATDADGHVVRVIPRR